MANSCCESRIPNVHGISSTALLIKRVISAINKYGVYIQGVFDCEGKEPTFCYSIGNSCWSNHPTECFCFYPNGQVCSDVTDVVARILREDENLFHRLLNETLIVHNVGNLDVPPVAIRIIDDSLRDIAMNAYTCHYHLGMTLGYVYPHRLVQILIADDQGFFPGQSGCSAAYQLTTPECFWLQPPANPSVYISKNK